MSFSSSAQSNIGDRMDYLLIHFDLYKYANSRYEREMLKSPRTRNKTPFALGGREDPLRAHRLYFPTNYSALSPEGRDSPSLTRITGRGGEEEVEEE